MEEKTAQEAIGQRIREQRELLQLSREEFAEILRLSNYYIGQLERGERQMSLKTLLKITNCLHLSLDYLILGRPQSPPYVAQDDLATYRTNPTPPYQEIITLLNNCSPSELELINKLLKTLLPYLKKS